MGRKPNFTREEILNCAFEILNNQNLKEVTARNIAKKLGASTIAIYSTFKSMDELKNELSKKAKTKLFEYTKRDYTNLSILNIGIGICLFAKEEKALFRTIFLREGLPREFTDEVMDDFRNLIYSGFNSNEDYNQFPVDIIEWVIKKGWYFSHGYATLICTGFYTDIEFETFKKEIIEMGNVLIEKALQMTKERDNEI
ncbi:MULTISPECIES: TetR/AcrR family transcriptional regulator [Cetobacterium]|jgi:AcrR family transcriptional regulator|uniref:TetR/AcrR family transcriptional regulator n=1 Tax=Candidatus Cetobacterium colombiensis TaxID=3073100 RepID=A0ABU4WAA5_9FUSO|nr:TetR/AcrR family transcriptional regulator [Candidatus Cetobacterium colombiensis]MDX8336467.1 TetR/AcrR family transcriptional regulator [Candidatus Cetobacterium colombiensis]